MKDLQVIGKLIERTYSLPVQQACQDGPCAGQSVAHVHWHIMPDAPFDNTPVDSICQAENDSTKTRTEAEMTLESINYRSRLQNFS